MAQLRAFESARQTGASIPVIMCFEKQDDWGGQWNSSWRIGLDAFSEPVHSSMYRHLWSNGPKECLEFADYTFNMFDAQAWFARDVMLGRIGLPAAAGRAADITVWLERQAALAGHDAEADYQTDYLREIIALTDYPEFDLDTVSALFKQWMRDKPDNILGYRDNMHRSVMTGTMAARHHTRWINARDASLARYLQGL